MIGTVTSGDTDGSVDASGAETDKARARAAHRVYRRIRTSRSAGSRSVRCLQRDRSAGSPGDRRWPCPAERHAGECSQRRRRRHADMARMLLAQTPGPELTARLPRASKLKVRRPRRLSPEERKSLTHGDFWIPEEEREVYRRALQALNDAAVPYVVAGAYAIYEHTGIYRQTKDLDLFVEPPRSCPRRARCTTPASSCGWRTCTGWPRRSSATTSST